MRVKEGESDYRYFPEPDLPGLTVSQEWIDRVKASIPEMPAKRRERYISEYDLPEYDAMVLTLSKEMSDFFEGTLAAGADAKLASNWLMGEVSAYLNSEKVELGRNETDASEPCRHDHVDRRRHHQHENRQKSLPPVGNKRRRRKSSR